MRPPRDILCDNIEMAKFYIEEFYTVHPNSNKKFSIEERKVYIIKEKGVPLRWDPDMRNENEY